MPKERLDKLIVERGLAESRTRAQALIIAGQVLVAEQRADKPGQMIDTSLEIRIKGEVPRYVSRGGLKLEAALRQFDINPADQTCIDVGASTGGFTDCLLQHGAARVWAIDVGHNQLVWKLRQDARVVVIEGQNARDLAPEQFPALFDVATMDVSFISLTKIFPALAGCLAEGAEIIALVKPQFEVGRGEVGRGGIVTDPLKHRRVLIEIARAAASLNLLPIDVMESPIFGAEGNREFLMHLRKTDKAQTIPPAIEEKIVRLTP
jgi:23S rRNA (cytidine1920-2'-O)/16S rRNA (cytidine1409-2'-O)-methyltransferase